MKRSHQCEGIFRGFGSMHWMNPGVGFVLLFVLSSSIRDVYFSGVFQTFSFFEIIVIAFSLCTAGFTAWTAFMEPRQISQLLRNWPEVLLVNATTAAAWISYFYALQNLEPSIAHTLHVGIGPITITVLGMFGVHISRPAPIRMVEKFCHFGVLVSLLLISAVVLAGVSGLGSYGPGTGLWSVAAPYISGSVITISALCAKRMNENGISAAAILAVRFVAIVLVSLVVVRFGEGGFSETPLDQLGFISLAAAAFIVLPLYFQQLGIARIPPLTVRVVMALGPIFVFLLQAFEERLIYSPYTLACIVIYSIFALLSTFTR